GLFAAGRRRLGAGVMTVTVLLVGLLGYLAANQREKVLAWLVDEGSLGFLAVALPTVGLAWTAVIVGTYRTVLPAAATAVQRLVGSVLVAVLTFSVLTPLAVA